MNTSSFQGKTALIIDGSSGMGKATAQLLADNGAMVIIASKSPNSIDAALNGQDNKNVYGVQVSGAIRPSDGGMSAGRGGVNYVVSFVIHFGVVGGW